MKTRDILIVIFAFFVGGIAGFIINGQLCAHKMNEVTMNQMMGRGAYQRYSPDAENSGSAFRGNKAYEKRAEQMLNDLSSELNLNQDQKNNIESKVRDHLKDKGFSAMKKENVEKMIDIVKSELSEDQKSQFDDFISERIPPYMMPK